MLNPANRPYRPRDAADALSALREWREQVLRRDQLVMAAIDAGVNDDIIEFNSGVARSTIRRIHAKALRRSGDD
jgi:hypothetical protein